MGWGGGPKFQVALVHVWFQYPIGSVSLKNSNKMAKGIFADVIQFINQLTLVNQKGNQIGTSLAVQWLRLHTSTAGGTGSIPVN